ncbi:hypothetical protein [Thiolapillus sp.]|uniref:hypothetical protein n=1 Tax=Thiolapillus sp. TaxID=2017437 RepID=UPI003AF9014A
MAEEVFPVVHGIDDKRVFGLVIDFGTSQSPKSTRPLTTYLCPSRPGHQALRNNFASSLLLRTWLPYDWTPRSEAYFVFPLAQGTPGKQCGLAATGVYQPSLRSPWLAASGAARCRRCRNHWRKPVVQYCARSSAARVSDTHDGFGWLPARPDDH